MATVINTGLTTAGVKAEFQERFNAASKLSLWQDVSTRLVSTTQSERYGFLGTIPPMREWGTGRLARGLFAESYDVANLKYEITLEVDRDELSDDQTGAIRLRINEMADRAASHRDSEIGRLLINGDQTGFNSYDGVTFFNASHESGVSGPQDNTLAPSAVDADVPTVSEFKMAVGSGIARLLSLKDDQGEPMSMSASGLVAIVPPSMYVTALEALSATLLASTSNVLQGAAMVKAFPWLSTASVFYLLKTDVGVRPFVFQDREPVEFTALEQDSDEGFRREKFLYGVRARYRMTYGYWQYALKLTFTE